MDAISQILTDHDFLHFGFVELTTPLSMNIYEEWIQQGRHGDMQYLQRHMEQKRKPQALLPNAQSAIVMTFDYASTNTEDFPLNNAKVARYAKQADYHHFLKDRLKSICDQLSALHPEEHFLGFTDSSPVLERDLAHRAGLGWFGKNSCLLDRERGSLFFIAEIYTSLQLTPAPTTMPDHCGTCNKCIEACPTDAILDNRTLDAQKCISYWTIESRKVPPVELRKDFSGWLFGCDICQTVCPWNLKIHGQGLHTEPDQQPEAAIIQDLQWILTSSNKALERQLKHTPLSRAGGKGLKRNAMIVAANLKLRALYVDIEKYLDNEYYHELATWCLKELSS